MSLTPPITGNEDLDAYLYNISINGVGSGSSNGLNYNYSNGLVTDPNGNVLGYLYQYIHIKYADDNSGTNLSDSPTNKTFYGIKNSTLSTESVIPSDYTWYEVSGTFGTSRFLYFKVTGGRQIKFSVDTSPENYTWVKDTNQPIDLDLIIPLNTISSNEILDAAITELKIAAGAVSAAKTNIASIEATTGNLVANSVGTTQITDNAVVSSKITTNAVVAGKIAANAVTASTIEAGAITTPKIQAGAITAASGILGTAAILEANIANAAITNAKIQDAAITNSKIQDAAITNAKIANLSVDNAKIVDAAITTAKIGVAQIDTLRIGEDQVTIPRGSSASGFGATVTITLAYTAPVALIATFYGQQISGFGPVIRRDGVVVVQGYSASSGGINPIIPITITGVDNPGVGTFVYTVDRVSYGGGTTSSTSLFALGAKR